MTNSWHTAGTKITLYGNHGVVSHTTPPGTVHIKLKGSSEIIKYKIEDLENLYSAGEFTFKPDLNPGLEHKTLSNLSTKERLSTMRRLTYVKASLEISSSPSKSCIKRAIIAARSIDPDSEKKPPSVNTVYKWVHAYLSSSKNIRSLISNSDKRGNRNLKIDREIKLLIDKALNEKWLTRERRTLTNSYRFLVSEIKKMNRDRNDSNKLEVPDFSTFKRHSDKLDKILVTEKRYGNDAAKRLKKVFMKSDKTFYPLQKAQIDDTPTHIFCYDEETMMPLGRPLAYVCIDVHSSSILGIYLGFEPSSYTSLSKCLSHAILPKKYIREKYPEIKNDWYTYGVMHQLVADNAKQYISTDFDNACIDIGINEVIQTEARAPWNKGQIESFFKTLNTQLLAGNPGYTFSNIFDRGDYDPKKNGIISIQALDKIFHIWICDVYHQKPHGNRSQTPMQLWQQGIKEYPPTLPASADEILIALGSVEFRKITHHGIEIDGLHYNSADAQKIRIKLSSPMKIKVKILPDDIGSIYVEDPETHIFIRIYCTDQDYASGKTRWQHKINRKFAMNQKKSSINTDDLIDAEDMIRNSIEIEISKGKKGTNGKSIARYNNIQGAASDNTQGSNNKKPINARNYEETYNQTTEMQNKSQEWPVIRISRKNNV